MFAHIFFAIAMIAIQNILELKKSHRKLELGLVVRGQKILYFHGVFGEDCLCMRYVLTMPLYHIIFCFCIPKKMLT